MTMATTRAPDTERTAWTTPLSRAHSASSGSKAGHLAALRAAGFTVPDGFVIASAAFELFVREAGLAAPTQEAALVASIPPPIERSILEAYEALGGGRVAVRSSGLAEDLAGATFAGQYETILDVADAPALLAAVRRCWASVFAARVSAYRASTGTTSGAMAVLVQRMLQPIAAGVAFTADPVTGARDRVIVSAVAGLGEALVSGQASAEEWVIEGGVAQRRRTSGEVLTNQQARAISELALRVQQHLGGAPQDVEWALDASGLHLLQARPMTALPEPLVWRSPHPGAWVRNFRLGEWIGDPLTPLFDGWLLERIESLFMARLTALFPMKNPPAVHVTVNGWYFYGLSFPESFGERMGMLGGLVRSAWRDWRYVAGFIPPTAHMGFDRHLTLWRQEILPAYERAVQDSDARIDALPVAELPEVIEELAGHAAATLMSIIALGGTSAKLEGRLIELWREHVDPADGAWVMALVRAEAAPETPRHAVTGLDWYFPTAGERADRGEVVHADVPEAARERMRQERARVEAKADSALSSRPRIARRFAELLAFARRAHVIREEQSRALTLGWPPLRRAIARIGESLVRRGLLAQGDDVHFLSRGELDAALAGSDRPLGKRALERRATWQRQRRLSPPLLLGELTGMWKQTFAMIDGIVGAKPPEGALRGMPGSPGRVTAKVRVLWSLEEIGRLREGEVLVTPVTTPAWTPAFALAAAVVTDTGSIASHASIVAREYGIPAVVAAEGATSTLVDGQMVTVDGTCGFVVI